MGLALVVLWRRTDSFSVPQGTLLSLADVSDAKLLVFFSIFFDPLAVSEGLPQVIVTETSSTMVMRTKQRDDRLTCCATVVMRDTTEKMATNY